MPSNLPSTGRHALVISVDGLAAARYVSPSSAWQIPNLLRLKKEGSFAEGVVGVYPSVTYPSHTTIVTGRLPAEHGIYSNRSSRQAGKNPEDWFWFAKSIRVPTLWEEARRAGLSTAAVSWPVTAGAQIDWNIPEIWDPAKGLGFDLAFLARYTTPGLLLDALKAIQPLPPATGEDAIRTRLAAYFLKKYRPNLLLVHLADLDEAEHNHGPESPEATATLEQVDARIGDLLAAVKEAGLESSTDVFIVSDHGFLPVDRVIEPNALLAKAGLLQADREGRVTGGQVATVANGGSFFIYWPSAQSLRSRIDAALKPLEDQGLLWGVLEPKALAEIGADPEAQMALEAPSGAEFGIAAGGEFLRPMKTPHGAHGFLPFRQGLEASLIAWGPDIRAGVNLHRVPMTVIGPTVLKTLGVSDPEFGAQAPLLEIFR